MRNNRTVSAIVIMMLALVAAVPAWTQAGGQAPNAQPAATQNPTGSGEPEGKDLGGYIVHQSFEFGGRLTDVTGSWAMYNTFVNQQQGPRLLDQTLSMISPTGTGALFDSLTLNSFGWGGDPSNAARLRVSKNGWYNFNFNFRRDINYFDYDLLANPLNPASTIAVVPTVPIVTSPHAFYNRRRMYDTDLVIAPQRKLSFRLGYSRNRNEGPSFSTVHFGTEALLAQPWNTTANTVRFGADYRILPQTTISYTQNLQFLKNDTGEFLAGVPGTTYLLANGTPVLFGVSWGGSNAPCSGATGNPVLANGNANPACSGYISYSRLQRMRTYIPTEQLSLRSSSLRWLDVTGTLMYSSADMKSPTVELFNGLESRTALRGNALAGSSTGRWVNVVAETGVTLYLTRRLRLVDTFRFNNYRVPAVLALTGFDLFSASPGTASMLLPVATTPPFLHTTSSEADVLNDVYTHFVGQDTKTNEIQLQADFAKWAGIRAGYRFRRRSPKEVFSYDSLGEIYYPTNPNRGNCASPPNPSVGPTGTCTFVGNFDGDTDFQEINEHRGILGLWFRPSEKLHFNTEVQLMKADSYLVRIDPTRETRWKADASYVPKPWLSLGANFNLLEQRNPTQDFRFSGHLHDAGFNVMLSPSERFGFDAAYNYYGFLQSSSVCFAATPKPAGNTTCVNDPALIELYGNYDQHTHFGMFSFTTKPLKNLRANLGYSITATDGNILTLNALQPKGTVSYQYQQPTALIGYTFHKGWEARAGWNYFQYDENSFVGPTAPRYFHANNTTLSIRYEF